MGSLVAGKQADIVAVSVDSLASTPIYDPTSALIYAIGRDQVRNVWVAGQQVVAEGVCMTVDKQAALSAARSWVSKIRGN